MALTETGGFRNVLQRNRSQFNSRFYMARARFPGLDGEAFSKVIVDLLAPVAEGLVTHSPETAEDSIFILYDAAAELTGRHLLGPGSRCRPLNSLWRRILPEAVPLLAGDCHLMVAALSNAVVELHRRNDVDVFRWLEAVRAAVPVCSSPAMLLDAGKVAAWLCGCVQYRRDAVALCRRLDHSLASVLFASVTGVDANELSPADIRRACRERWFVPGAPDREDTAKPFIAASAGGFIGYGGVFRKPPLLSLYGDTLIASDGENQWYVYADAFGSMLVPVRDAQGADGASPAGAAEGSGAYAPPGEAEDPGADGRLRLRGPGGGRSSCTIGSDGRIELDGARTVLTELARPSSLVTLEGAVAITTWLSHHVYVVASPLD